MNTTQQLEAVMLVKQADWQDWTPFVGSGRDVWRGAKAQLGAANDFTQGRWKDGLWNSAKGVGQTAFGLGGLALDTLTLGLGSAPKAMGVGALKWLGKGLARSTAANAAVGGGMMGLGKMFGSQQAPAPGPTQVANQAPQMDLPTQRLSEMMNSQYQ